MAIVSSTHTVGQAQIGDRVWVRETHTDQDGKVHVPPEHLAPASADHVATRNARALTLYQGLIEREIDAMLGLGAALTLRYADKPTLAAAFRERYRGASREEAARLAKWLLDHIDAGVFTDTQVRNAFGLNAAQWTTLKARMTTLRSNYEAVLAAQGE